MSVEGFGWPRRHFRLCDSTNERARMLVVGGAPSGTVVSAEEQTAGRGRGGRRWSAPRGRALLSSAILRPLDVRHRLLPLSVPLAICEAIESLAPVECEVKWPNDVWIDERKVAGVLIEAQPPEWGIVGVGINLAVEPDEFPDDLRWPAASVGHDVAIEAALGALCAALGRWVWASDDDVLGEFRARDALRDRAVSWEGAATAGGAGSGRGAGIADDGNLIVETPRRGRVALGAGEVQLLHVE